VGVAEARDNIPSFGLAKRFAMNVLRSGAVGRGNTCPKRKKPQKQGGAFPKGHRQKLLLQSASIEPRPFSLLDVKDFSKPIKPMLNSVDRLPTKSVKTSKKRMKKKLRVKCSAFITVTKENGGVMSTFFEFRLPLTAEKNVSSKTLAQHVSKYVQKNL
jgi:hypothetical protein